jgi:hypothetical protein
VQPSQRRWVSLDGKRADAKMNTMPRRSASLPIALTVRPVKNARGGGGGARDDDEHTKMRREFYA